jgi:hypothetical protein
MKDLKDQINQVEKENAELINRTITIPLTEKQLTIINKIGKEKEIAHKEFQAAMDKEQDVIDFVLEFKEISKEEVETLNIEGKNLVIVKVPKKKEKEKENEDESINNGQTKELKSITKELEVKETKSLSDKIEK